jgi:hypothetical protein
MTSWEKTALGTLTAHIHNLFEVYFKEHHRRNHSQDNSLLEVRNLVLESLESFLKEPSIGKQYGVPIDSLSRVSFACDDEPVRPQSSWIPVSGGEDKRRPAGITNEEFAEFSDRLSKLFVDHGMHTSGLFVDVLNLFRNAYLRPGENRPFSQGTYTRLIFGPMVNAETIKKQIVPCEVCGENRAIDACHIIPRRVKGTQKIDNVLLLCPTHHRLFDACMLSKEEWERIDWTRKSRKAQIYAAEVLKVAHESFWKKVEAGNCRKQTTWEIEPHGVHGTAKQDTAE